MRVLMFLPIPILPPDSGDGIGDLSSGGWLGALISAMMSADNSLEVCALCVCSTSGDIRRNRIRFVYADKTHYADEVRRLLFDFNPDIIHINGTESFYGALPRKAYGGVPTLVSLQGIINGLYPHFTGGLTPTDLRGTNFNLRYLLRRTSILNDQLNWRNKVAPIERRTFSQHCNFAGRTEWDHAWVKYLNPNANYYVAQESLRDPFYREQRDPTRIVRHSIFCGGAAGYPLKGAHVAIRAIAALRSKYPDIQLRIAASRSFLDVRRTLMERVKDIPYAIYLRRLIAELGVRDRVVALDTLSGEEVAAELCKAELFLLPSFCENSPNSLGEAMLVGTPSIAAYVGGIPSILRNGIDGLLVPSGDVAAFADAIDLLFSKRDLATQYAFSARVAARIRYDRRNNAKTMLSIYKQVVGGRRK